MIFHKLSAIEVESFINQPFFIELTLAGIAAFNANICLFGGSSTDSYKIKAKTYNQRIKKIMNLLTNHSN
jgi:hypothetical protein